MKKLLLSAMLICVALTLRAESIFWKDVTGYQPQCCAAVASPSSACNQGEESFTSFLEQWNSSANFRSERVNVTPNSPETFDGTPDEKLEWMKQTVGYAECMLPLRAQKLKRSHGCKDYATWYIAEADCVAFCSEQDCGDAGGGSLICGFERIKGIWYLTFIAMAG